MLNSFLKRFFLEWNAFTQVVVPSFCFCLETCLAGWLPCRLVSRPTESAARSCLVRICEAPRNQTGARSWDWALREILNWKEKREKTEDHPLVGATILQAQVTSCDKGLYKSCKEGQARVSHVSTAPLENASGHFILSQPSKSSCPCPWAPKRRARGPKLSTGGFGLPGPTRSACLFKKVNQCWPCHAEACSGLPSRKCSWSEVHMSEFL